MEKILPRLRPLWVSAAVLSLVFVVYGRSLSGGFVFDDHHFVENNRSIRSLSNVLSFFSDPSTQSDHPGLNTDIYRPLTTLSFALDHAVAGTSPAFHRTVNLLLHCCNVLLLIRLCALLGFSGPYAALAGAFFALFPTNVESFVWISGRSSVLSTAFILCSAVFFVKRVETGDRRYMLPSALAAAAGLFTRETAAAVPLIALAYVFACGRPLRSYLKDIGLYLALPAALFVLLRFAMLGRLQQAAPPDMPFSSLAAVPFLLFAKYAEIVLFPFSMMVTYTDAINARLGALAAFLPAAGALALGYAGLTVFLRVRGQKAAAWGLLWALAALLPVLNIISIAVYAAERLLYLPLAGLGIVFAAAARGIGDGTRTRSAVMAAAGGLFLLYAVNIQDRLKVWRDDVSLWSYDSARNPGNFLSLLRLADALRAAGDRRGSYTALEGALGAASDDRQRSIVRNELGTLRAAANDLDGAEPLFSLAAELDPGNHLAFYNLAMARFLRRDLSGAAGYLERSLRLNGTYAPARALAGALEKRLNDGRSKGN